MTKNTKNQQITELEAAIKKAVEPLKGMPIALSGGIDSGILAALIKPEFAITVNLPGGEKYNEIEKTKEVAEHLGVDLKIVHTKFNSFDESMRIAVKAIGRPIPHFNIFPLYEMYKKLDRLGVKDIVVGDGPDESMCGYTRHLIMNYLHEEPKNIEAFENYLGMFDEMVGATFVDYAYLINQPLQKVHELWNKKNLLDSMCRVDMELMRPDMKDMGDGIAKHFGITIHRPYESKEVDEMMFNLPPELKIHDVEYGKYALRVIAEKYLPALVVWNRHKMGGPLYPVNKKMGWMEDGEFSKYEYIKLQERILNE